MNAAALIARGVAPVKKEFLVFKPAAGAADHTGSGGQAVKDGPGGGVDGAGGGGGSGAGAGGSGSGAATAAGAAPGSQQQQPAAATTGDSMTQPKSKNQMKRERQQQQQKQERVCVNFLVRTCAYGDRCRFVHDAAPYLASKPPDPPGTCPFTSGGAVAACPYGITCRWATTHTDASGETARAALDGREQEQQQPQQPQQEQQQHEEGQPAAQSLEALTAIATAAGTRCSPLPPLRDVRAPLNALPKDVQMRLWKGRYDFGRADAVLKALGVELSARARKGHDKRQQQPQQPQQQPQPQQPQPQQPQPQQPPPASAAAAQRGATDGAEQPPLKRARAGDGTVAVAGGVAGADSTLEDLYAAEDGGGTAAGVGPNSAQPAAPQQDAAAQAPGASGTHSEAASQAAATDAAGAAEHGAAAAAAAAPAAAPATATATAAAVTAERAAYVEAPPHPRERRPLDLRGKTYLAPLTTVGNLPFRRVCKDLGCDITCGEMALATNLLQGQASEWALLKRHPCEDVFGVQICGGHADSIAQACQVLSETAAVDFVDLNCGCPIDIICARQAGSALLTRPRRFEEVVRAASSVLDVPLIVKMRKGYNDGADIAHEMIPRIAEWGAAAVTLHGRTRQQRYSREADWEYIERCGAAAAAAGIPLVGNGDILAPPDWDTHMASGAVATCMIGRGALIKPWIFTEIREQRLWDISAGERFDYLRQFASYGLEHWGSDARGVETTRRFLLEWLSFTHRYVPVGLLEVLPQQMSWRPPSFVGRNDLETLLGSESAADWVRISEMLLGRVPPGFSFAPKHRSNATTLSAADAGLLAQGLPPAAADGADSGEENG
ncbi:tRNA-dihydrouridine synthase [Raphidocelis subcapitata]|uniref:tRNA-dihydrouridine(47) synthase [NAD(P)(+)] n=1 Tax=Raphidocelis subcapitata TaxID=307507 RepID=A0A2V0NJ55_9CHLO|nr:tRNA-dihydrouridine synthase [Raphidocelis subcapitata]|eukprot:GBF87291.1 tRNA-dihydrouridine synthase [Raphidocelis subcapitata]